MDSLTLIAFLIEIIKRLAAENEVLRVKAAKVEALEARVAELQKQVEELKLLLKQNSQNSSKPPSSDPPWKKAPPKAKREDARKPGGQPGHEGVTRPLVPPEQLSSPPVDCKPKQCRDCFRPLFGCDPNPQRHQVIEIPEIKPTIEEYRIHTLRCPCCGTKNRGELPGGVPKGCFGYRIFSLIGVLTGNYRLSLRNTEEIIETVFNVEISLGSVKAIEDTLSELLAAPVAEATAYVQLQFFVNADETSWRHMRDKAWLWAAVAGLVAIFMIRRNRNQAAAQDLLGTLFSGVVGTDRFSSYSWIDEEKRQMCWSHLKRDFLKIAERPGPESQIGKDLESLREELFRSWYRMIEGTIKWETFQGRARKIRGQIKTKLEDGAQCGDKKIASLCRGILKDEESLWTFTRVQGIEPTNNAAERALRHAVIWRKTSYGTQSEAGRLFVERILTVVTSLRLQKRNVLEYLAEAVTNHFMGLPVPSILPQTTADKSAA